MCAITFDVSVQVDIHLYPIPQVHVPEFSQLKQCENELVLLRELWEYIEKVKVQLRVWEESPWTQVDLDALEMQCKVYMRDIKLMDKEMRSWDNFIWLQETIKNILVALRAIHQLRNPAIKDRHWTRLSSATQVIIVNGHFKKIIAKAVRYGAV